MNCPDCNTEQLPNLPYVEEYKGPYIKYADCVDGATYFVLGRNIGPFAFFIDGEFHGIRYKFGFRIDSEIHWDQDSNFGTCKPIRRIC